MRGTVQKDKYPLYYGTIWRESENVDVRWIDLRAIQRKGVGLGNRLVY